MYITYKCRVCDCIFTMTRECVKWGQDNNKYISCPYGHRKLVKIDPYEDLEKCMGRDSYKRDKGAIKQTGWDRG